MRNHYKRVVNRALTQGSILAEAGEFGGYHGHSRYLHTFQVELVNYQPGGTGASVPLSTNHEVRLECCELAHQGKTQFLAPADRLDCLGHRFPCLDDAYRFHLA